MTDPRTIQRQLIATRERADELQYQLERMSELVAPLLVHESMVRKYDGELAEVRARLTQLEER